MQLRTIALITVILSFTLLYSPGSVVAQSGSEVDQLIQRGEFSKAEQLLKNAIADPDGPIVEPEAVQLEILRRTRLDFTLTEEQLLAQLKDSIEGVSADDIGRWRDRGDLLNRVIDGEVRYFRRAGSNLFLISEEARKRRTEQKVAGDKARSARKFDITGHIVDLVKLAESAEVPEIFPVSHRVKYQLAVKEGHPRLKEGAVVRAWLPFPQEYRQQRDVELVSASPEPAHVSPNGSPHRSIYFEQTVTDPAQPPVFSAEFTFLTSAYYPKLDSQQVEPYDTESELYQEYTRERAPHIVFSSRVQELAAEIVGDEQNPLEKARKIFCWVSKNVPWVGEMEYCTIPNLSEKGLAAGRGDCGVQGMVFITLCRAAGVPARWQSGWETKPNDWNMHDWSEIYIEPWGWLPVDASYGMREHDDPRVRDFYCGHMDPYRLIVNLDYARPFDPEKTSFRSEPNDFQRGEIEIDGHNLYFNEWTWKFEVETHPFAQ